MEGKSHFGIKNEKRFGAHASLSRETSLFRFFKAGTLFTFRTCTLQRLSLDAKTIFSVKRQENCYNETAGDLIQCSSNNTGKIGTTVREHAKNCSTPSVAWISVRILRVGHPESYLVTRDPLFLSFKIFRRERQP
jgi:hypothetical protein